MSTLDKHPILGQLTEKERQLKDVSKLQDALEKRRAVLERDGKLTTVVAGIVGISGLFFMKTLSFYLILGLLVIGLPLVWRQVGKHQQNRDKQQRHYNQHWFEECRFKLNGRCPTHRQPIRTSSI